MVGCLFARSNVIQRGEGGSLPYISFATHYHQKQKQITNIYISLAHLMVQAEK